MVETKKKLKLENILKNIVLQPVLPINSLVLIRNPF